MANPKIATIVPKAHLELIRDDDYFMALSYAASDPEYVEFFKSRADAGAHVILDNSTVELGAPEAIESYLVKATEMNASEILAPDWLAQKLKTIAALHEAVHMVNNYSDFKGQLMAVPQGADQHEWFSCATEMLAFPEVKTLGISRRYGEMFGGSRFLATMALFGAIENVGRTDVKVHLLGCWNDPTVDILLLNRYPMFQGADGSVAAVMAKNGLAFRAGARRPEGHIEILTDRYDSYRIRTNIDEWRRLCGV